MSRAAPEPLEEESLAVAETRPTMMFGIPMELAATFGIGFFAIDTELHSMLWGLIVAPFWFLAATLVRSDHHGFHTFVIWLRTAAVMLDGHLWGGATLSPFPVRFSGSRGIPDDAV